MKINCENSCLSTAGQRVAEAMIKIVSPHVPSANFNGHRGEFIPQNITLKEISRYTGMSVNAVDNAITREVTTDEGYKYRLSELVFIDTKGVEWVTYVGMRGNKNPKRAARIAGHKIYGAENRIRQSLEKQYQRENTSVYIGMRAFH